MKDGQLYKNGQRINPDGSPFTGSNSNGSSGLPAGVSSEVPDNINEMEIIQDTGGKYEGTMKVSAGKNTFRIVKVIKPTRVEVEKALKEAAAAPAGGSYW